jgi:hypothetical protein
VSREEDRQTEPLELGSRIPGLQPVHRPGALAEQNSASKASSSESPGVGELTAVVGRLRNGRVGEWVIASIVVA